ncbi:MAG: class I SAM-dependent methyltransferase [Candidatus Parcubacteria bacterium]|nr:class I SAM-dependent methyltransferase [Candidatus Parcubacteria bacterium]
MRFCLTCNKNIKKWKQQICSLCSRDPFKIEEGRKILAKNHKIDILRKMYNRSFAEIKNVNTGKFWDKKLWRSESCYDQDGMTRDRVEVSVSFVPHRAKRILDVGVGHGFFEERILSEGKNHAIYGIDIAPQGIRLINKKYKGEFSVGSIYNIKYPNGYFDVVSALEVLEHIPPHRVFAAYKEINRVLSRRGTLIVSVPLNEGLRGMNNNPSGHVREYSKELIISELQLAGFKTVSHAFFFAFEKFYIIKKILQKVLWFKWKPNNVIIKAMKI